MSISAPIRVEPGSPARWPAGPPSGIPGTCRRHSAPCGGVTCWARSSPVPRRGSSPEPSSERTVPSATCRACSRGLSRQRRRDLVVGGCSSSDERPPQTDVPAHPPRNHATVGALRRGPPRPCGRWPKGPKTPRRARSSPSGWARPSSTTPAHRPASSQLTAMPPFPGDVLDPAQSHREALRGSLHT